MLTLIVLLSVHPGHESEFEQFESAAAQIMRRYGGKLERRIGRTPQSDPAQPEEMHIVTFPDQDAFHRYRADSELASLAELRARAIRQTTIWYGADLGDFKTTV
jgi:uncharacterized protein (DUF1330 family)